jgi:hypothetical protein
MVANVFDMFCAECTKLCRKDTNAILDIAKEYPVLMSCDKTMPLVHLYSRLYTLGSYKFRYTLRPGENFRKFLGMRLITDLTTRKWEIS